MPLPEHSASVRWAGLVALLFGLLLVASPAQAFNPDEVLDDPVLEQRARDLSSGIRCMTCQNQSIDDSEADLARDLRIMVRERLVAGDSDKEVLDYLVDRYGEFVLLKPRFSMSNLVLWIAPALALLLGGILSWRYLRRVRAPATESATGELTAEEHERLTKILDDRE